MHKPRGLIYPLCCFIFFNVGLFTLCFYRMWYDIMRSVRFLSLIVTVDDHLNEGIHDALQFDGDSLYKLHFKSEPFIQEVIMGRIECDRWDPWTHCDISGFRWRSKERCYKMTKLHSPRGKILALYLRSDK